jgi:hypothetical protein
VALYSIRYLFLFLSSLFVRQLSRKAFPVAQGLQGNTLSSAPGHDLSASPLIYSTTTHVSFLLLSYSISSILTSVIHRESKTTIVYVSLIPFRDFGIQLLIIPIDNKTLGTDVTISARIYIGSLPYWQQHRPEQRISIRFVSSIIATRPSLASRTKVSLYRE